MTLPEVTERFAVNHLEEHATQLRESLG